ncbi:MAG: von Willebrand factor type A domain-containing protein, partial [Planctomycetota bacterium]|nr:von Willebrand factor type A domain-containing protein [Planctomycetota bacterium]
MSKLNLDDPKLTAYALGELEPAEAAEIEKLLNEDEAARAFVDETRAFGRSLETELAKEAAPGLTPEQKDAIADRSESPAARAPKKAGKAQARGGVGKRPPSNLWAIAILAAAMLLVGVLVFPLSESRRRAFEAPAKNLTMVDSAFDAQEGQTGTAIPKAGYEFTTLPGERDLYQNPVPVPGPMTPTGIQESPIIVHEQEELQGDQFFELYLRRSQQQQQGLFANSALKNRQEAIEYLKGKKAAGKLNQKEVEEADVILKRLQDHLPEQNTEAYNRIYENPFKPVRGEDAVSTFSIDVDTASYSNTRRHLNSGQLPPPDAVRIEELINYFGYDYAPPTDDVPFSANVEVAECPWEPAHRLVRVGLKGRTIAADKRPLSNLVFLLDVSGSMNDANKLPLVKESLKMLVNQLGENDRVAIVVYAGASGLALPSTRGSNRQVIVDVLDRLSAGGSTNGGEGIELAYKTAAANFIEGGVNRVIVCTDGDWNVGVTSQGDLTRLIEEKAKSGVFLSVLGFGMGNLKDATMEQLADKGNGHYGYIDTLREAKKMFVDEISGTLVTIAKDVKIQVEFNPAAAGAYRLIGYENRVMAREDFNDDTKDAGEIGAGHTVTALYEVVPAALAAEQASKLVSLKDQLTQREAELAALKADKTERTPEEQQKHDAKIAVLAAEVAALKKQLPAETAPLKYQEESRPTTAAASGELLTLKLRYKAPDANVSKLLEFPVKDSGKAWKQTTQDYRFAASVAAFGMMLRQSQYKGLSNWLLVQELAAEA